MPTSIRLAATEKRRIAAAARKQGVTPAKFIKDAALARATDTPDVHMGQVMVAVRELIADEVDAAIALDRIERQKSGKGRLYTGAEAWREWGL